MNFKRKPLSIAISVAVLASTTPALAQEAAKDKNALETVIVTATKRSEPANKVPFNISVISEAQLREQNITDIKKLIAQSESIDAPANGARFADSVTVRGLNVSSASANNIEWFVRSTLSYYLDDTPLPNIGYRIKDVARVETLIGPQGTLYGAGALGGTVRYITNKPQLGKTEASINTSIYQTKNGGLSNDTDVLVNLPLGDKFALRASLARLDEKGYTDRFAGVPAYVNLGSGTAWQAKPNAAKTLYENDDWQRVDGSRISLLWQLSKAASLTFAHTEQSALMHGTTGTQLVTPAADPAAASRYETRPAFNNHTILSPHEEFADRDFSMNSIDLDWDLGFATLHSATSTFEDTRVGQADYLGTGSFFYGDLGYSAFRLGSSSFRGDTGYITFDNRYEGLSHETRLTSNGNGPLRWAAGFYHTNQKRSLQYSEIMPGLESVGGAIAGNKPDEGYGERQASDYTESAIFGEASYKLTDRLSLNAGARMFNYKDETETDVQDFAFDLVSGVVPGEEKKTGKSYFKLGAAYQLTNDLLGYATLSQGFRRGGANGFRNGGAQVAESLKAYKPDSTDNLELGVKGYLLDRQLYLQASVFQIDWKDTQTYFSQDINGFPVWGTTNGPQAQSKGVELAGRYRLNANWQASFGSAYTTAEWAETKEVCLYADGTECRTYSEGGVLGGTPKWKHRAGVRYSRYADSGYDFFASLNGRYTGRKPSDRGDDPADTPFEYASYTLFDASVGVSKENWEASLWVQNLLDEQTLVSFQGTSQVASRVGLRAIYVQPRTVGVNFSYKFK